MAHSHILSALSLIGVAFLLFADVPHAHARTGRKLTAPTASAVRTFMASLPLNISVTTPAGLLSDDITSVYAMTPITVVFSRPVIALGSDFDSSIAINKVPFRLSCKWPGKTRWVTTSIVRYDPAEPWPSDLSCDLIWNTALRTYDGVRLQLGDVPVKRPLGTSPLFVYQTSVVSDLANNVTGGQWNSGYMALDDKAPEVPPDGRVQIYFSYTVNLKMLQSALQLLEGHPQYTDGLTTPKPKLPFIVRPCYSSAPWLPKPNASSLDINATCADVMVGASLKPDTWYTLRLPEGSRYNLVSGPLAQDLHVSFAGLRPFRVPFSSAIPEPGQRISTSTSYRRWDMLLPHSLAPGTTAADLAASIRVCEPKEEAKSAPASVPPTPTSCIPVPFNLTLPTSMVARLTVPGAQPGKTYRVYVFANPAVKDGFGQPLQASSTEFSMSYMSYTFKGPETGRLQLAVLESDVDSLSDWPYITRAPRLDEYGWPANGYPRNVTSYTFDVTRDSSVSRLFAYLPSIGSYDNSAYDVLGDPSSIVYVNKNLTTPGSGVGWTEVSVPLGSKPLQLLYSCCTPVFSWYNYGVAKAILRTSLSLSVIQTGPNLVAWVTDASVGGGSGPVVGADVDIYSLPYFYMNWEQNLPYKVTTCKTNSQGYCVSTLPPNERNGNRLAAVARSLPSSGGVLRTAILPFSGWALNTVSPPPYLTTLALDRRLLEPGDSVKITGFVQAATSPSSLSPVPESWVFITVFPDFDPAGYPGRPVAVAKLNATTGTFHVEIPFPASAAMGNYDLAAFIAPGAPPFEPLDLDAAAALFSSNTRGDDGIPQLVTYLTSTSVVISSPRPPTAELKVVTDPWVTPTGVATVNVTAVSYIGASVGDSPVTVIWSISGTELTGRLDLVTDVDGFATGRVDLAAAVAAAKVPLTAEDLAGESIAVQVEWIGPTRERIKQSASIKIALGPVGVVVAPSLHTDIPGVPFTIAVQLPSSVTGANLDGIPVTATLRPASAANTPPAACSPAASAYPTNCTTVSGAGWAGAATASATPCRFALPCVGEYVVEACANVPSDGGVAGGATPGSVRVCGILTLGRNASVWAAAPLSQRPQPLLELDKPGGYRLGERPRLWLDNPYSGARLLVVWGTTHLVRAQVFSQLPAGSGFTATLPPLGSECATGCTLTAVLDVPRLGPAGLPAAALPPRSSLAVSSLFDPRAPHSIELTASITVLPDNELAVEVAVVAAPTAAGAVAAAGVSTVSDVNGESLTVVEPGASAQITVDVGAAASDGPVEVTVYAVDKAFLDLLPYNLPKPQQEMILRSYTSMELATLDAYRIAPGSVRAVYNKLLARLTGLDPWLPPATAVTPSGGLDPLDINDAAYLALYTSYITTRGGRSRAWDEQNYYNTPSSAQRPPPSRLRPLEDTVSLHGTVGAVGGPHNPGTDYDTASGAVSVPPASETTASELRRSGSFVVTPLFAHALVGADGRAAFNFTAPQNLGAFVIRAFAAAGSSAKYGSAEGKLVVRRSLSLTPSVPPFVRVGDTFEAGVVVTLGSVGPTAAAVVRVGLQLRDAAGASIRVVGASTKNVTFTAAGGLQQEVRFSFRAVAVGTTTLVVAAADGSPDGGRDALELEIPVEGQQGDVWIATSFALASNASSAASPAGWAEGMELPGAVPGSGGLSLTAGVGYLPSLAGMYDNLATTDSWRTEPSAQPALLWATLPAVLSYYGQAPSSAQAAQVSRGASDLTALTDSRYGLSWWLPSRWSGWYPTRTDISLNLWALFVVNFHARASSASLEPVITSLVPQWRSALERQLVRDVANARDAGYPWSDWNTLAWVRLTLGASWAPSPAAEPTSQDNATLSLENMLAAYRSNTSTWQFDRQTRMILSLVLLSMGRASPERRLVNATVTEVTSSLRVQGRTAYVSDYQGSPSAASLEDQALALLLLIRSGATHQLLPKLAAFVASPTTSSGGGLLYFYAPWGAQALAAVALTEYDRSRGSSKPSVDLRAEANGLTVLQASFRVNRTRPVSNTTAWEDLPPPPRGRPSELNFAVSGTGEVTVAASLHFVPTALPAFPTYRGLFVDAAIQLVDLATGRPTGPRVASVPLGSIVSLTVQVTSPDDLGAVTLSVMMPGGLEPMDPNVVPDAGSSCFTDWLGEWSWSRFYPGWWWWPVCPAQETRPSLVTFSYAALRAGTTTATIKAVAATVGTFVVPPVRASVDEQPEVMGMTAAGSLVVCSGCAAATAAPAPRVPKPCPGDCNDNGVCNLSTGVCVCDVGFGGADCARVSLAG